MATLLIYPQISKANGFTAADVLTWSKDQQDWYFQVSVGMAYGVATRNATDHADCIDGWYYASGEKRDEAHEAIREAMTDYSTYNPVTVLIAVIERECGKLSFQE